MINKPRDKSDKDVRDFCAETTKHCRESRRPGSTERDNVCESEGSASLRWQSPLPRLFYGFKPLNEKADSRIHRKCNKPRIALNTFENKEWSWKTDVPWPQDSCSNQENVVSAQRERTGRGQKGPKDRPRQTGLSVFHRHAKAVQFSPNDAGTIGCPNAKRWASAHTLCPRQKWAQKGPQTKMQKLKT